MENIRVLLEILVWQNPISAYLVALATFFGVIVGLIVFKKLVVFHIGRLAQKTQNDFDDFIVALLTQIGLPIFSVIALYAAMTLLTLPEAVRSLVRYALIIVLTVRSILIFQEILRYSIGKIYARRMRFDDPATKAMISSTMGVLRWVLWSVGLIFVLDNLGVDISALVAGIGIGGVAVALAAQAILGDAFSAFSIFLDRPFEIGDFVIIDEHMGTVEHVGIKTTRIRSLSGEQLIFSNSDLTKSRIKNYKRMESRRIVFKISVVYQTPIEKARKIPLLIKDIFQQTKDVRLDRVHFQGFGDFALIYEIVYYVLSADYSVYMDRQQEINFAIMESFEKEKIAFAYPTQTLYVAREGQAGA